MSMKADRAAAVPCVRKRAQYTHPVKWKNQDIFTFLKSIEPHLSIQPDSCICRNCHENVRKGQNDAENFCPRWRKELNLHQRTTCEVSSCSEPVSRSTQLASRDEISEHLEDARLAESHSMGTNLCDKHYRSLQKKLNPVNYQWKCVVCSAGIRGSNYSTFRACSDPDLFQNHLVEHTDFQGKITASDKVCSACYRHCLTVHKIKKENLVTNDADFLVVMASIQETLPAMPFSIADESQLIAIATKYTVIHVAQKLLDNHALTLLGAYSTYLDQLDSLLPLSSLHHRPDKPGTPRWLLSQLSSSLQHHMSYTCKVRKHGVILFRQGREIDALSHALHAAKVNSKCKQDGRADHVEVCNDINQRINRQVASKELMSDPATLDIDSLIRSIDHTVWNAICILTQSSAEKRKKPSSQLESIKKVRRLFILCQIMFCIDNTCYMPFHILTADLIDSYGGAAELIKIFNRLGVCVSNDTLMRHIQQNVQESKSKGILQGLDPNILTVFTLDNIDFLHSHAQVFAGNQHLSWHGTTIQAVQAKPSHVEKTKSSEPLPPQMDNTTRRRPHVLLSPMPSPDKGAQSPLPKRFHGRPRTGTEFKTNASSPPEHSHVYSFQNQSESLAKRSLSPTVDTFRPTQSEKQSVVDFTKHSTSYCLLKNSLTNDGLQEQLIGIQAFFSVSHNTPSPEVASVAYVEVLDEVADEKDTILHVINNLYVEYACKHGKKFVVLEGDAKTYDTIQAVKFEYGAELGWLIPYPGDWHLLKNYQICLMKPFFEAGLKDLAIASGYPAMSIQSCSNFQRTHSFLMETWEGLYRHMLKLFLAQCSSLISSTDSDIEQVARHTLEEFNNKHYDATAIYSVIRSFQEATSDVEDEFQSFVNKMSAIDDTWKFWGRFVFEDCLPYIALFIAIRGENWNLRTAAIKMMAANFTAFDHPIYQKLITNHVLDMMHMPDELLAYFRSGGFAVSISGHTFHSVGLDESHEMLINKHVKQAVVRPTKDYINRIARHIPRRVKYIEHLKRELFGERCEQGTSTTAIMFTADPSVIKKESNIQAQLDKLEEGKLLPLEITHNRGVVNSFRDLVANDAQRHDLLNFHQIGREMFEARIKAYILKTPSVKVPQRRKKLQTFGTKSKVTKQKVNSLKQEIKQIQKCMRRKIAYANKMGTKPDVIGEQYIELPWALCDVNGSPIKGQKSIATKFYLARYRDIDLVSHIIPNNWVPTSVIIEGMFIINTKPLHSQKIMAHYGSFIIRRFIIPFFQKGSSEVHLLFDCPGNQSENPKVFEQTRRDTTASSDHLCTVFFDDAEIPTKWQESLRCRKCKRRLTQFLSSYIVLNIRPLLRGTQKFITSGATDNEHAIEVTKDAGHYMSLQYDSDADESDTRIWIHAKNSAGNRKYILSPDTDVYHIGLPMISSTEEIIIQLSKPSDKELNIMKLHALVDALVRDPDLAHISHHTIPQTIQALFVSTGCDYVSFFSGIGKAYFFKVFFEHAKFIVKSDQDTFATSFTHMDLNEQSDNTFPAFVRLIGCAYFKKHTNAFLGETPESLFHSFVSATAPLDQHKEWLDHLRKTIWDRISFEDEMIPSFEALRYHWLRSCWILHMWQQAQCNHMMLAPLHNHGWTRDKDDNLSIYWDTEENRKRVKSKVALLMKGCSCKSGCGSNRCGCHKRGEVCGPGCRCVNCNNTEEATADTGPEVERTHYSVLQEDVSAIMENVFGPAFADDSDSDSASSEDGEGDSSDEMDRT